MTSTTVPSTPSADRAADRTAGRAAAARAGAVPSRAWAVTGAVAGAVGIAAIQLSLALSADWQSTAGDPEAVVASYAGKTGTLLAFHVATMLLVPLLLVFAAGLQRRLAVQAPAHSLLPAVAASGLGLVAVAALLGAGLDTQFIFGFADAENLVAESGAFYADWVATIPWLWVGAGVSGVALAVAALRHGAAPRWIGVVGLVLGGITLLFGLSPLQYMAGFTGPLWLLVTGLGFALGDRR
ncbi:hypothetical protein [Cellulomonas endophytica]|uniref:hypothetical protein n=1 Tax=Cellulomonas endophytica TaxID=2494735 RepID=UPI001F0C2690|nr:hypothetical protein [Cellulomonas endophytica]